MGFLEVEGVVPGSVISISTVPRIALVDGKVDTSPLFRPEDQLNTETIQHLRREVVRRGYNTGVLVSADGKGRPSSRRWSRAPTGTACLKRRAP